MEKNLQGPRKYVIIIDGKPVKAPAQNVAQLMVNSLNTTDGEDKKKELIETYTGMLLGIKTVSGLALKKSPVAGWSYVSRNKELGKGRVFYTCDTSPEYGNLLVACAPNRECLTNFLEQSSILDYALRGIKIATSNSSITYELLSRERFKCYFLTKEKIKPGEILTQDYASLTNHETVVDNGEYKVINFDVAGDWLRAGAVPSLMTVTGEPVPDIKGKVKTHFIEGVEVEGNTARLKFTVLPPDTQLHPDQKIIGDVGTTLYAYDERLHQAFAETLGSQLTADPIDLRQIFYNPKIANAIYPPMILEQKIDKDSKKQNDRTTTEREIKDKKKRASHTHSRG